MPDKYTRALDEYKLCHEQIKRLEASIWQTATLFGVGSGVGLVAVATQLAKTPSQFAFPSIAASLVGIVLTLVWWRFAQRWWSIQHVYLSRMRELELSPLGFEMGRKVKEIDDMLERNTKWLAGNWQGFASLKAMYQSFDLPEVLPVKMPDLEGAHHLKLHEYRGMVESSRLLVYTIILLWSAVLICSFIRTSTTPVWGPTNFLLTCWGLVVFAAMLVAFWGRR